MPEETQTQTETNQGTETAAETKPETDAKERIEELNTKLKAAEERNELLEQNQALIRANTEAAPAAPAFDPYKEVGLEGDEDIPNVGQQKRIDAFRDAQRNQQNAYIRFRLDHPDYSQLVGTDEQTSNGEFAAPLMKAFRVNPTLLNSMKNSPKPWELAYSNAKIQADKEPKGEGDKTKTTKDEAKAAIDEHIENAARIKTSANAKGGEGLSEEGRTANMPDAEYIKEFKRISGIDL